MELFVILDGTLSALSEASIFYRLQRPPACVDLELQHYYSHLETRECCFHILTAALSLLER
jgi:hypothetical protein